MSVIRKLLFGKNSKGSLVWAFSTMLFLIVALILLSLSRMTALNAHLDTIVNEHIAKTDLIVTMRNAARDRSLALHRMAVMPDPFDREQEFMRFSQLASEFLEARATLSAMRLSEKEHATLDRLAEHTGASGVLQNKAIEQIQDENFLEANTLLVRQVVPAQDRVIDELSNLLTLAREASKNAVMAADRAYRLTHGLMIALGIVATGLGVLIARAVTRRTERIESALADEKTRAEVTLHSIGEAVITMDVEGRVDRLNKIAQEMTGWNEQEAHGMLLDEVMKVAIATTQEDIGFATDRADGVADQGAQAAQPVQLLARDGREFTIEQNMAPIRDTSGQVIGSVVVFRDVSQSHELSRKLSWAASHDALTGLPNRRQFERRIAEMLDTARLERKRHALLYLDLDQFKVVNDTCGHVAGDELLRQLAGVLTSTMRSSDTLARLGGDEFGILLEGCGTDNALAIAEKIRNTVVDFRFVWQDKVFEIGASIGVMAISETSEGAAAVMSAADVACYAAKDRGRNCVHLYLPDDEVMSRRMGEMDWVQRIKQALKENRFCLYRQAIEPIHGDMEKGSHYEILIRLQRDDGSTVPPMAFIPAAERYNLMPAIDRWVVRSVLEFIAARTIDTDVSYSINLSGQSIGDAGLLEFITEEFRQRKIPPQVVCFEVTETAAIANLSQAGKFITALREIGCRFSLDDFGSGMSSLAYLKNLPVDSLKIDGAFVRDIVDDPVDYAMVNAINNIAHVMGIKTIAEFVENQDILDRLKTIGVDYAQGYHIHKPEPLLPPRKTRYPVTRSEASLNKGT
ncbi:MAG: EAL domain-containing protein [Thiobacillus sp.]